MPQYLAILEVSQKQAYIFGSKRLADNAARSEIIRYVTEALYQACGASQEEHLVYAGGGHIILQFSGETAEAAKEKGREVVRRMTWMAYRDYGLELFAKLMPYDAQKLPGENVQELIRQLEWKKSLRLSAFHQVDTGLEVEQSEGAVSVPTGVADQGGEADRVCFRREHPIDFHNLADQEGKIAIVHLDGNNMGKKSKEMAQSQEQDWQSYCEQHRAFSKAVNDAFQAALYATIEWVERAQSAGGLEEAGFSEQDTYHPIRPIIAAGDDICFVTAGRLGLECAAYYLRYLNANSPYTACAGVVVVSVKYPFHRAYQTSEQLCDSAKKYVAQLADGDPNGGEYSAIDWHLEFGQGKKSLSDTREDYIMEDSGSGEDAEHPIHTMTLRPLCVTGQEEGVLSYRSYAYFINLFRDLRSYAIPRSKIKKLREAIHQGIYETALSVRQNSVMQLGKKAFDSKYGHSAEAVVKNDGRRDVAYFTAAAKEGKKFYRHSLYFDAIELLDHITLLEEEGQA